MGPRLVLAPGADSVGIREEPISLEELPAELRTPPEDYLEDASEAELLDPGTDGADGDDTDSDGTDADGTGGDDQDSESTTSSVVSDDDPAFVQAAEAEGAPPGIVPTDPEKAEACR